MLLFKVFVLSASVVIATSAPQYHENTQIPLANAGQLYSGDPKYDFQYEVDHPYDKLNYGHRESRRGDRTEGSYYVKLADGRLLTVTYYVDAYSGFVAKLSYEGEPEYSNVQPANYVQAVRY